MGIVILNCIRKFDQLNFIQYFKAFAFLLMTHWLWTKYNYIHEFGKNCLLRKEIFFSDRKFSDLSSGVLIQDEVKKIFDFGLFKIIKKIDQIKLDFIVAIDVLLEFN